MEVKRGDRISLNTKKRLYYFQDGDGGINLSVDGAQVAIIPESATDMHLAQINHAIKAEQLLIGWPENTVEMPEKDSDLLNLLSGGRNKVDEWIYALKDDKFVKANVKVYKIEKLVEFEKAGKNRKSVLNVAENVLRSIGGISPVEETEQEKIEIKLTSGNGEIPETT
jgi:hypothetical protein